MSVKNMGTEITDKSVAEMQCGGKRQQEKLSGVGGEADRLKSAGILCCCVI